MKGPLYIICKECGNKHDTSRWCSTFARRLIETSLCNDCDFWINDVMRSKRTVVVDGVAYGIGVEKGGRGISGFGGRKFVIKKNSGEVVTTTNLWLRGNVPERFRDRLPDTAEFLKQEVEELEL